MKTARRLNRPGSTRLVSTGFPLKSALGGRCGAYNGLRLIHFYTRADTFPEGEKKFTSRIHGITAIGSSVNFAYLFAVIAIDGCGQLRGKAPRTTLGIVSGRYRTRDPKL